MVPGAMRSIAFLLVLFVTSYELHGIQFLTGKEDSILP